jgi:hypothetical protein
MYFCLSVFGFVMMVLRILFMVIIEVGFVCAEFKFTHWELFRRTKQENLKHGIDKRSGSFVFFSCGSNFAKNHFA